MKSVKEKLMNCVNRTKSNVIVSIDLQGSSQIMGLVDSIHNKVLGIKLHSDIYHDESIGFKIREKYPNILIIEDKKFCDIGNTVHYQSLKISEYADLITVHSVMGGSTLQGLSENCVKNQCGVLLLAQASSKDNLIDDNYTRETVQLAKIYNHIVVGFICQGKLDSEFYHFTPGVKIDASYDELGQGYRTPEYLVEEADTDFLIVGRGITEQIGSAPIDKLLSNYNMYDLWKLKKDVISHNIIKYNSEPFKLKSGELSNVYADFRRILYHPNLLEDVAEQMCKKIYKTFRVPNLRDNVAKPFLILGVPMGAIPLSSVVAQKMGLPLSFVRDKQKDHGTKNIIEGPTEKEFRDSNVLLIEDVLTSGGSVTNVINLLKEKDLFPSTLTVFAVLDREKGAAELIESQTGCKTYSVFKLSHFGFQNL